MTSRRQARCDNRLALTFEARANIPRMRSRLAKWRPEIISVLARFGPGGTREGRARGQGRGIATWKLNYVSCCEMSCQGPWLVSTTNYSLQYAETCPLLIPPVRPATELLPCLTLDTHPDFVSPKVPLARQDNFSGWIKNTGRESVRVNFFLNGSSDRSLKYVCVSQVYERIFLAE